MRTVHAVIATEVSAKAEPNKINLFSLTLTFRCPNCAGQHEQKETFVSTPLLGSVTYGLECGSVTVLLPWCSQLTTQGLPETLVDGRSGEPVLVAK